jgi:hypothetical protein
LILDYSWHVTCYYSAGSCGLSSLSDLYQAQKLPAQAVLLYRRVSEICDKAVKTKNPEAIESLSLIAMQYTSDGQYDHTEYL